MDEFERWKDEYALYAERDITEADCLAAFKAGREAGMREAAEIVGQQADSIGEISNSHVAVVVATFAAARDSILSAIGGGK